MVDLLIEPSDRARAANDRIHSARVAKADLPPPQRDRRWVVLFFIIGCVRVTPTPPPAVLETHTWVDASAPVGGDGSKEHPLKALPTVVGRGQWHVATGLYLGPFEFTEGARVDGQGVAVLTIEGRVPLAQAHGASLTHLSFQGGTTGLTVSGAVQLDDVRFSGQRVEGLRVLTDASVAVSRGVFEGLSTEINGLIVERGATATVTQARFHTLKRAVDVEQGQLKLETVSAEGVTMLVRALDAQVTLRHADVAAGRGPAVFASGGALNVNGLSVIGQEYGLQAVRTRLEVDDVVSREAQFAGVAVDRCSGRLAHVRVARAGTLGGLQVLASDQLRLDDVQVSDCDSSGILVRKGSVSLSKITIERVRREGQSDGEPILGDGLQLRDAHVTAEDIVVRDVEGSGLWVSAQAVVSAGAIEVERCGSAGVVVERKSSLQARALRVSNARGPGVYVATEGVVQLGSLVVSQSEASAAAECAEGASVRIEHLEGERIPSRCIETAVPQSKSVP